MGPNSRRRTLKTLIAGAPAIWAEPVVRSTILPSHADLSICSDTRIIPGCTPTCTAPIETCTIYTFQFQEGCLTFTTEVTQPFFCPGPPDPQNQIQVRCGSNGDTIEASVEGPSGVGNAFIQNCTTPLLDGNLASSVEFMIEGIPYTASYTAFQTATSVGIGDITVAPTPP